MLLPPQTWDHCFDVKQIEWMVPEQEMCQRHIGSGGLTPGHMIKTHVIVFISTILQAVHHALVFLDAHSEPFCQIEQSSKLSDKEGVVT
jgi:hypothetical protein